MLKCSKNNNNQRMAVISEDCFLRMMYNEIMCLSSTPIKSRPKELYTDMPVMKLIPLQTGSNQTLELCVCVQCTNLITRLSLGTAVTSSTCMFGKRVILGRCIMIPACCVWAE